MSHEITIRANGFAEMAYSGEDPWHRLGNIILPTDDLDTIRAKAGMDYTIRRSKALFFADRAQTQLAEFPGVVALYRSDNNFPLGLVSEDYNVVQPYEIIEFFRDLVEGGGFKIETAGTLFGGKRYWALAKITEAMVAGWDRIGAYALLSTSADGTMATDFRETSVRVVCRNTIEIALNRQARRRVTTSHRSRFDEKKVKEAMGLTQEHFAGFIEAVNTLTKAKVTEAAAESFLMSLLRPAKATVEQVEEEGDDVEQTDDDLRRPRGLDSILALFSGAGKGSERKGSAGTAWGLVNAVTEYVDHHATARTTDHLTQRAWFGTGADLKSDALQRALAELV